MMDIAGEAGVNSPAKHRNCTISMRRKFNVLLLKLRMPLGDLPSSGAGRPSIFVVQTCQHFLALRVLDASPNNTHEFFAQILRVETYSYVNLRPALARSRSNVEMSPT
jgi:hypothetical protein